MRPAGQHRTIHLYGIIFALALLPSFTFAAKLAGEEYTVISAALAHGAGSQAGHMVIDETSTGTVISIAQAGLSAAEAATELGTSVSAMREWSRLNRKRYNLSTQLLVGSDTVFLTATDRASIFSGDQPRENWRRFFAKFPDSVGIVRLSRPGIDEVNGTALLYLEFECGAECGSGRLINLQRDDSAKWQVTTGSLVWITAPPKESALGE